MDSTGLPYFLLSYTSPRHMPSDRIGASISKKENFPKLAALLATNSMILDHTVPDPSANPGATFRFLYDIWVERGGFHRGKPRHSVRQMKDWLEEKREVRSLETKLAGKTTLQYNDALNLLYLFLNRWYYSEDSGTYKPYQTEELRLEETASSILNEIFPTGNTSFMLPRRTRDTQGQISSADPTMASVRETVLRETRRSREVIEERFDASSALITISRERTIIGSDQAQSMAGFQDLMASLMAIDRQSSRHRRALIWIVDVGLRSDEESSRLAYLNLEKLATEFRAVGIIDPVKNAPLWRWLRDRVVVLVGRLRLYEIDYCYEKCYRESGDNLPRAKLDLPWFSGDRLFLDGVPSSWLRAVDLARIIDRREDENVWNAPTVTAHIAAEALDAGYGSQADAGGNINYFYHGELAEKVDRLEEQAAYCIELDQPGSRWSNGFRLASLAAFQRLGWTDTASNLVDDITGKPIEGVEALGQLRHRSFAALRLDDFLRLSDLIGEAALDAGI